MRLLLENQLVTQGEIRRSDDGRPYRFELDMLGGKTAFADTITELISLIIDGYPHDPAGFTLSVIELQEALRRRTAVDVASAWQVAVLDRIREHNPALMLQLDGRERHQLNASKEVAPFIREWRAPVELIVVESSALAGRMPTGVVGEAVVVLRDLEEYGFIESLCELFSWTLRENARSTTC